MRATLADLPANARAYVKAVEEMSGARISAIGVGPGATRPSSSTTSSDPLADLSAWRRRQEERVVLTTRRSGA